MANCKNQKFGHNFPYTGANCLNCGINQHELSFGKKREEDRNFFDGYLEKLKTRQVKTKAKNYMQETAEPYLRYIWWDNKTLFKDMKAFYAIISRYYQRHTHAEFVRLLEWIKSKDSLHPRQCFKLFSNSS